MHDVFAANSYESVKEFISFILTFLNLNLVTVLSCS